MIYIPPLFLPTNSTQPFLCVWILCMEVQVNSICTEYNAYRCVHGNNYYDTSHSHSIIIFIRFMDYLDNTTTNFWCRQNDDYHNVIIISRLWFRIITSYIYVFFYSKWFTEEDFKLYAHIESTTCKCVQNSRNSCNAIVTKCHMFLLVVQRTIFLFLFFLHTFVTFH